MVKAKLLFIKINGRPNTIVASRKPRPQQPGPLKNILKIQARYACKNTWTHTRIQS